MPRVLSVLAVDRPKRRKAAGLTFCPCNQKPRASDPPKQYSTGVLWLPMRQRRGSFSRLSSNAAGIVRRPCGKKRTTGVSTVPIQHITGQFSGVFFQQPMQCGTKNCGFPLWCGWQSHSRCKVVTNPGASCAGCLFAPKRPRPRVLAGPKRRGAGPGAAAPGALSRGHSGAAEPPCT